MVRSTSCNQHNRMVYTCTWTSFFASTHRCDLACDVRSHVCVYVFPPVSVRGRKWHCGSEQPWLADPVVCEGGSTLALAPSTPPVLIMGWVQFRWKWGLAVQLSAPRGEEDDKSSKAHSHPKQPLLQEVGVIVQFGSCGVFPYLGDLAALSLCPVGLLTVSAASWFNPFCMWHWVAGVNVWDLYVLVCSYKWACVSWLFWKLGMLFWHTVISRFSFFFNLDVLEVVYHNSLGVT